MDRQRMETKKNNYYNNSNNVVGVVSNNKKPLEWLNEPYYLLHFLAFFAYFILRSSAAQFLSPHSARHLLHREIQAVLAFALLTAYKLVRVETWEAFVSDSLFFAKVFLVAISLIMDYHLAMWYMVVFSVMYILTQQPAFEGLGNAIKLTPLQLETLLTEGNASKFWLVEFRASCSSDYTRTSRCFPELSITYSNKHLSFGTIDLGLFPNVAEKFGISLSGMGQLPTYILFENATEVTRFPEWGFEPKVSHPTVTKRLLCQHFELDRRLLEYVHGR
uniref:Thioredoxin-related transmembrane protein 2 n=2 Tax=Rhizophora mucronata TaxID=61149 RepID=A0A2P2JCD6_RHIMU